MAILMRGRRIALALAGLLVIGMARRTAATESDPGVFLGGSNPAMYEGDGAARDNSGTPLGYDVTTSAFSAGDLASNDAAGCKQECEAAYPGNIGVTLIGFSWYDDTLLVDGSANGGGSAANNYCICYVKDGAQTTSFGSVTGAYGGPAPTGTYGWSYCYNCVSEQPSSQPSSMPSENPSISAQPSSMPSESPSSSSQPSSVPSENPSLSAQPSSQPSENPSVSHWPSSMPSENPSTSTQPSSMPSENPSTSAQPSSVPSENPSSSTQPSSQPSENPSSSAQPSSIPSENPSISSQPSSQPSENPSLSAHPSSQPSENPSVSHWPSSMPSENPSSSTQPSSMPSENPSTSAQPSSQPSENPSISTQPSSMPSENPSTSAQPSSIPSENPSISTQPSSQPSSQPSGQPSSMPSENPSISTQPSSQPSENPSSSVQPSSQPSSQPSAQPSAEPSRMPSSIPSAQPSNQPSAVPSEHPSISAQPSSQPSENPSISTQPSSMPSMHPSVSIWPTSMPSENPSISAQPSISTEPSSQPSEYPSVSIWPTSQPSSAPSSVPSGQPSAIPSTQPSNSPSTEPSNQPSAIPSGIPSSIPSAQPSNQPSAIPSRMPSSIPSAQPSNQPSAIPSRMPSSIPSSQPSNQPSAEPSRMPSSIPSAQPSRQPSAIPSAQPSNQPSAEPSRMPSSIPSKQPSGQPSAIPSTQPSNSPSEQPSGQPSSIPSTQPSSIPSTMPSTQPSSMPSTMPSAQPSESPSANPSQGCENMRTDCGWGIFNPWTCRCDCPVGICLDNNQQCYTPCTETINTNPFAGCSPGWDCPWFPDTTAGYCKSELHQPNNFEIYRTAKECCDEHFGGSTACMDNAKTVGKGHAPFPWPIHFPGTPEYRGFRPYEAENHWGTEAGNGLAWFPDLLNKRNCVWGNNYENWMSEDGFDDWYLFGSSENCCEKWYPGKSDCPDTERAVNPEAEDEPWHSAPYSARNYFFPDFEKNSCGFGRDYPAWMGINGYEKTYLFTSGDGDVCCQTFFANSGSACPYENELQNDYYWTSYFDDQDNAAAMPTVYNHTYYPDINLGTCINGTDYPDWMRSDVDFERMYLFKSAEGCCNQWFNSGLSSCMTSIVQGLYDYVPCPENRPDCDETPSITDIDAHRLQQWYPALKGGNCRNDQDMPSWMLKDDYAPFYLYNTYEQCCAAFGYC